MGAKITVGGIEITVPVGELGEAMKQLAPWADLKAQPVTQAPKPAVAWPFPTGNDRPTQRQPVAAPTVAVGQLQVAGNKPDTAEQALLLFKRLLEHRASGGLSPEEVMKIVNAAHPKGIGNRMQSINTFLKAKGLDPDLVYSNNRGPTGSRVWLPGPKIGEAIKIADDEVL